MDKLSHSGVVLLCVLIAVLVSIPIKWLIRKLPTRYGKSISEPLGDMAQISLIGAGAYVGLRYAQIDITILLAVLAIFTAGVSLALDTSVKDAIACFKLLSFHYYEVGEQVTIGTHSGEVTGISIFTTTINVGSKGIVIMGNAAVADSTIINHSRVPVEVSVKIPVTGWHNREETTQQIRQICYVMAGTMAGSAKIVHGWDGHGECYAVTVKVVDYQKRHEVQNNLSITLTDELEYKGLGVGVGRVGYE